jgi:hypothetical protein
MSAGPEDHDRIITHKMDCADLYAGPTTRLTENLKLHGEAECIYRLGFLLRC